MLDADPATRVCSFPQALDMTDEMHLHSRLPTRPDAKLAAKSLVVSWLVAEHAGCSIVSEDLRHFSLHGRSVTAVGCASARE